MALLFHGDDSKLVFGRFLSGLDPFILGRLGMGDGDTVVENSSCGKGTRESGDALTELGERTHNEYGNGVGASKNAQWRRF